MQLYQERFGITMPEWRVLATLGVESPLSAGELGQRTNMEKVRVSRTLNRMLAAGLIRRQTAAHDHRMVLLRLSRRGADLYRRIVPLVLAWEGRVLEVLSGEEQDRLYELLGRLQERLVGIQE